MQKGVGVVTPKQPAGYRRAMSVRGFGWPHVLRPDYGELWRRCAKYADRILRGARSADLPAEQAATFELVINLKTAKALGVAVPKSFLLRANEVIQ